MATERTVTASDLLAAVEPLTVRGEVPREVRGLAYDSRAVGPGFWFFALPGTHADGARFAPAARAAGAAAVVSETDTGVAPEVRVQDARRSLARASVRFYGDPAMRLTTVGITGTNGKTTVAWLLRSILEADGWKAGIVGTLGASVEGAPDAIGFTTPEAPDLNRLLAEFVDAGAKAAILEVSSHALALHRAAEIPFDVTVYTNLSQDHLDFHRTMAAYLDAKLRLFDGRNGAAGRKPTVAVVNAGDAQAEAVLEAARRGAQRTIRYGTDGEADVVARLIVESATGSRFVIEDAGGRHPVEIRLPGRFNVENALAAWAAAGALGISAETRRRGLVACPGVPGRFEPVRVGQPFAVYVDFAHTPAGLAGALTTLRAVTAGKLHCLIGAGGGRDPGKRPEMGRIAAALADHVVFTSDNPRHEDPAAILSALVAGVVPGGRAEVEAVLDRREAIARILAAAGPGDTVLLAGKGHETTQTVGGVSHPFDDRVEARAALHRLGYQDAEVRG